MTTLSDQVRALVSESKIRIDFDEIEQELRERADDVNRDNTLLELERRGALAIIATAIEALKRRHDSADALAQALESVETVTDVLDEFNSECLAKWYFYLIYRGHQVAPEATRVARVIVGRRQGNATENNRRLRVDLDRYEWLAAHGARPSLSGDNAHGVLGALDVLPLPSGVSEELATRARAVELVARARSGRAQDVLLLESFDYCERVVAEASAQRAKDSQWHLGQVPSFCIRVTLGELQRSIGDCSALAPEAEQLYERLAKLRAQFDAVAYRSSSTVSACLQQELTALEQALASSIDFEGMWSRAEELKKRVREGLRGREGIDRIARFHSEQLQTMLSSFQRRVEGKRRNGAQLEYELARVSSEVEDLECLDGVITAGPIKRLAGRLKGQGLLDLWANNFPHVGIAKKSHRTISDLRLRLSRLWRVMEENEPTRVENFCKEALLLTESIRRSTDPGELLTDILNVRRSLQEFSPRAREGLRKEVDGLFSAFRERVEDVDLLAETMATLEKEIDRAHRRIYLDCDCGELFEQVARCKRWVLLRDFPGDRRGAFIEALRRLSGRVYALRARQGRLVAERQLRAEELYKELEAEIGAAVANAVSNPASRSHWEDLVALDRQVRGAWDYLSSDRGGELRERLDRGFSAVRDSRTAFAVEAEQRFATYCEQINEIAFLVEEEPTRESAIEAIGVMKELRPRLREELSLMKHQKAEVSGLLAAVSQAIDEIFDRANAGSAEQYSMLSSDLDTLEGDLNVAADWSTTHRLVGVHKKCSAGCRDASLSIQHRKQLRSRLDELWEGLAEKLQKYRFERPGRENLASLLGRLEQQGWLALVSTVPRAS